MPQTNRHVCALKCSLHAHSAEFGGGAPHTQVTHTQAHSTHMDDVDFMAESTPGPPHASASHTVAVSFRIYD